MQNYKHRTGISRRDFLKGCSYVAATALLGACGTIDRGTSLDGGLDENTSSGTGLGDPNIDSNDSYSFHIHPSADVLDSVQSFVKFATNDLDAVVESSQPMFMLSTVEETHDGSFGEFNKTYGQPEILHLQPNDDGSADVVVNSHQHSNNIGLVQETKIALPNLQISHGDGSYGYNQIVACNGSKHNRLNDEGKFISQKMALVGANSKMGLGNEWNSLDTWYATATKNEESELNKQLVLLYQYDEIEPLQGSNDTLHTPAPWKSIDLLYELRSHWIYAARLYFLYSAPFPLYPLYDYNYIPTLNDLTVYRDKYGKEFLYGTINNMYSYNIGFIVTFEGSEPQVHWFTPQELEYATLDPLFKDQNMQYNARYAYLSMLLFGETNHVESLSFDELKEKLNDPKVQEKFENTLGKQTFRIVAALENGNALMAYDTLTLYGDVSSKDDTVFTEVPLKPRGNYISSIETKDHQKQITVNDMVYHNDGRLIYQTNNLSQIFTYFHCDSNYSIFLLERPNPSQYVGSYSILDSDDDNAGINHKFKYENGQVKNYDYYRLDLDSGEDQWYVKEGLTTDFDNYFDQSKHARGFSSNREGQVFMHFISCDKSKFSFICEIGFNPNAKYCITNPQPFATGVERMLPWSNYLHNNELLYIGKEQKNIAPLSAGENSENLSTLTHKSTNDAESYFYGFSDYLERNWKLVELQTAPHEAPKHIASIHKIKQKIHQATLVLTDQNHNQVTLKDGLFVEIRSTSGAVLQDVTHPDKIKKANINRTTLTPPINR